MKDFGWNLAKRTFSYPEVNSPEMVCANLICSYFSKWKKAHQPAVTAADFCLHDEPQKVKRPRVS